MIRFDTYELVFIAVIGLLLSPIAFVVICIIEGIA
jgi:hypothetical protein